MPQLGETVSEGKITKWFKSAGDQVKPGDNLFEIETDKVSMEVPSTTTGVLAEIRVAAGAVAYTLEGHRHDVAAMSLDGQPIQAGADVVIDRIENGLAFVERWEVVEGRI